MKKILTIFEKDLLSEYVFYLLLVLSICTPANAVSATPVNIGNDKVDGVVNLHSVSNKAAKQKVDRKLTWREKIGLKIIQKSFIKKTKKKAATSLNSKEPKKNGLAIASLLCGTVGLFIPFLGSIAAIILGIISLGKIKNQPDKYSGKVMAIIGMTLGALYLVLLINYLSVNPFL